MKDLEELLKEVCRKEIESGCYDIYIDNIPLYRLVRYMVRIEAEKKCGFNTMETKSSRMYCQVIFSSIISLFQLLKILLFRKKYENVIISFPRVDKVNGVYLDKFTDPIIDLCEVTNYVIFDHGRGGEHPKPRYHDNHIVYSDVIHVVSSIYEKLFFQRFCNMHKKDINQLENAIDRILGCGWNKDMIFRRMLESFIYTKIYDYLFHKIEAKRVMGPARDYVQYMFIAAHKNNMMAYELQHGITYSESELYSGMEVPEIEPDYFFAFGNNKPDDVYGIDLQKIVNIGWAFQEYVSKYANITHYGDKDVFVISSPEVSKKMVEVVDLLAESFPKINFYFRPHPHELLSSDQVKILKSRSNVCIHDSRINIMEALYGFNHVIGESSTALYEAMSIGKKVGRIFMMGLNPMYLQPEDKECSWEIRNEIDFERFLKEDISTKKSKSIYSKFDKEKFLDYFMQ